MNARYWPFASMLGKSSRPQTFKSYQCRLSAFLKFVIKLKCYLTVEGAHHILLIITDPPTLDQANKVF